MGNIASKFKWVFGVNETRGDVGAGQNLVGTTGAGVAFNTRDFGESFTFLIETDAGNTCAYQIRNARTSSGPWAVLSSGTLTSNAMDVVQLPGPLGWLSPRIKTLKSTGQTVVVYMTAVES